MEYNDMRGSVYIQQHKSAIMEEVQEQLPHHKGCPDDEHPLLQIQYHQNDRKLPSNGGRLRVYVICTLLLSSILAFGATYYFLEMGNVRDIVTNTPLRFVNRTAWDARDPRDEVLLPHPPADHVIIIHTTTEECTEQKRCSQIVRIIQSQHMDRMNYSDIAYNFLVGGDGQVYEGRGWDVMGALAKNFSDKSLGIAFIGDFNKAAPPNTQLDEAKELISESVKQGKLSSDYKLIGHRQVTNTDSPGEELYDIIRTWPHWEHCYKATC